MPSLADHHSQSLVKMLLIGNSGAGKTGAMASLAKAGYQLKIVDFDNGLDILSNVLRKQAPTALSNVDFETFTDTYKTVGAQLIPAKVEAWENGIKQIEMWSKLESPDTILVLDSLSLMSRAGFNWVLKINNKQLGAPEQQHWLAAQTLLENLLAMLFSDAFKMNIIITSHIQWIGEEGSLQLGYPSSAVGKSFSPKIPRFFNSVLLIEALNNGTKREIVTNPTKMIDLKNSSPFTVKPRYDITTGLADFFFDATGRKPGAKA